MNNSSLKKVFFTSGLAILTGVVLFGLYTAKSAVPTVEPPGDNLTPTFTGITVNGLINALGDLNVSGAIYSRTNIIADAALGVRGNAILDSDLAVHGDASIFNGLNVRGSISNDQGDLTVSDNLDVNGKLTADSFGTYSTGSFTQRIAPAATNTASVACSTGKLISCGYKGAMTGVVGASDSPDIQIMKIVPDLVTNTCFTSARNNSAGNVRFLTVYAVCLNPAL